MTSTSLPYGTCTTCRERLLHVGCGVQRLDPRLGVVAGDVQVGRVFLLNLGRVGEHDPEQVAGRRGAVDRPVETLADERRQVAAVVDVGVAEDDRVDLVRVEREVAVPLPGFLAAALVQPAVEQDLVVADFEQVHGPGDAAGRPPEGEGRLGRMRMRKRVFGFIRVFYPGNGAAKTFTLRASR